VFLVREPSPRVRIKADVSQIKHSSFVFDAHNVSTFQPAAGLPVDYCRSTRLTLLCKGIAHHPCRKGELINLTTLCQLVLNGGRRVALCVKITCPGSGAEEDLPGSERPAEVSSRQGQYPRRPSLAYFGGAFIAAHHEATSPSISCRLTKTLPERLKPISLAQGTVSPPSHHDGVQSILLISCSPIPYSTTVSQGKFC
jgi:hypothetical protein